MNKDMESTEYSCSDFNSTFDDVFRTMAQKMPFLMIPIINEAFGTDYTEDQTFEQLRNEFYESYGKVITDSILKIGSNIYHIECQSQRDGRMAIRMLEYDIAIAQEHALMEDGGRISIRLPRSCVFYIRNHRRLPVAHEVRLYLPDGRYIDYSVPVIRANRFDAEEIFEKGLLMLLPYYVLRYEHFLKRGSPDDTKMGEEIDEFRDILERLMDWSEQRDMPELLVDLTDLMRTVVEHVLPEGQARERLGEIMGGNILKLKSEELLEEGHNEGRKEGRTEERKIIALRMFKSGMSPDQIADMVDAPYEEVLRWVKD